MDRKLIKDRSGAFKRGTDRLPNAQLALSLKNFVQYSCREGDPSGDLHASDDDRQKLASKADDAMTLERCNLRAWGDSIFVELMHTINDS
jgi:hypothetical protein